MFIELNFAYGPDWVQHEIIPVSRLEGAFIEAPDGNIINIRYRPAGSDKPVEVQEKYSSEEECRMRWRQIRNILGAKGNECCPLPYTLEEFCGGD